ncbi:MAG: sugar phosphate isomerase/epimerase [Thermoprotei archaeon]|nr:MAG: sugar phosphate isomerase/epimerase [Thermoprotei archaeon]
MFKLGINTWSYPKTLNIKEQIIHAKKTGYDGFEPAIVLEDLEKLGTKELDKKWEEIKNLAKETGIEIPSVATGLYWRYNWLDDNSVEKALKVLEAEARAAWILGAKVILVVPGSAIPEIDYEVLMEKAVKNLSKAEKIAEEYNIKIGLENVWNKIFAGPYEYNWLLDKLNSEIFGAYFDAGNTLPHSLPEHWIKMIGNRILQVHVKDFNMAELRFGIPLTGDVNWHNVRKALEEVGYSGYIFAEIPPYRGDPFKAVEDTYTSMKKIFK